MGNFDILIMDIELKFMDGMTAAQHIRKMDSNVIIIFVTNMPQFALKGYQVDALDYVLKPNFLLCVFPRGWNGRWSAWREEVRKKIYHTSFERKSPEGQYFKHYVY